MRSETNEVTASRNGPLLPVSNPPAPILRP
jgi:hypothetical protein